jgi:hypothetical protein
VGKGDVVAVIKWCRGVVAQTLYVAAGVLVGVDWVIPRGGDDFGLTGLLLFMVAATLTILHRIDRCVGRVWDAGGRAERRRAELEAATPAELAVVHDMVPRR